MRNLYLLTTTEAGAELGPGWEVNNAMLVVADSQRNARQAASERTIDEPAETWLSRKYSSISKVGVCTNNRVASGVLLQDNNAS